MIAIRKMLFMSALSVSMISCNQQPARVGWVEQIDPALSAVVHKDAQIRVIADGLDWCEGPLWIEDKKMLLFSDVPQNIIYKWTEAKGKEPYLTPSGYTGGVKRGGETGSNGLVLDPRGQLVICQHGDRRMARMDAPLDQPKPQFVPLATNYNGKKFDSPNDATYRSNGDLYFTDPPYGLEHNATDPLKEMPYQGVYKVTPAGEVTLLADTISRPNGLAFFPGHQKLLVASSDSTKPYWYIFDVDGKGLLQNGKVFADATAAGKTSPGLPDGMKIDREGHVFATGPGGIWIFDATGKLLGKIHINPLASNCSFSADEKTLYITADMHVLQMKMR